MHQLCRTLLREPAERGHKDKKRRLSVLKTFEFEKLPLEIQRKIMGHVESNVESSREFVDVVCSSPAT